MKKFKNNYLFASAKHNDLNLKKQIEQAFSSYNSPIKIIKSKCKDDINMFNIEILPGTKFEDVKKILTM